MADTYPDLLKSYIDKKLMEHEQLHRNLYFYDAVKWAEKQRQALLDETREYERVLLSLRAWAEAEGHAETQRICEAVLKTDTQEGTK